MRRESIRIIGFVVLFATVAAVIIFHEEISAMVIEAMMGQAGSMLDQLFR